MVEQREIRSSEERVTHSDFALVMTKSHSGVAAEEELEEKIAVSRLEAWYGSNKVLNGLTLGIAKNRVTGIIGPSGCGKSTFIRCLNRMHENVPGAGVKGKVLLDGADIYDPGVNPVRVRRRVGMVFQRANPFPTMSVRDNVLAGLRLQGARDASTDEIMERALKRAALWGEVKDRLRDPATGLSGGQQQRLCIARALALEPDVILMDEPCSALDPSATYRIEELIYELKENYTVVIVTHNMQQAARVADRTAFLLSGELIEYDATDKMFTQPADSRTEDYVRGRFG